MAHGGDNVSVELAVVVSCPAGDLRGGLDAGVHQDLLGAVANIRDLLEDAESAWLPPCVVLVINDNLYGLIFALRYLYRSCPWEKIGVHVLDSRRVYDYQGSI